MVRVAKELSENNGWFLARQFENEANPEYHRNTTAPEILRTFAGRDLDYFVSGYGTGGTITGVGEVLKIARPNIQVIATEPDGAALLSGEDWQPHKIQGWTPDFIPDVLNTEVCDQIIPVSGDVAKDTALALAQNEGIFCGISAGATFAAALVVAESAPKGSSILAMLPDTGERYLSTFLFDDIKEGSDEDVLATLS
jgi:cysteine synthase A